VLATCDIVDDETLTHGEVVTAIARSLDKRRLYHLPAPLTRLLFGVIAEILGRSQRVSNRLFKEVCDSHAMRNELAASRQKTNRKFSQGKSNEGRENSAT